MINIIGGIYLEIDFDDLSSETYGSGFRASKFLFENQCNVKFHTAANKNVTDFLEQYSRVYSNFSFIRQECDELITFQYNFSLDVPKVFPALPSISKVEPLNLEADNIVAFGMLEMDFRLKGRRVVYDPQTSLRPRLFSDFGIADELVYIVNKIEAQTIASTIEIAGIKKYFFDKEKTSALIIKDGPFGAKFYLRDKEFDIPSYATKNVFKIGSGDIFTSSFSYYWMHKKLSLVESARFASKSTAIFCDKGAFVDVMDCDEFRYVPIKVSNTINKQVYLAAPFFSLAELILVDKVRAAFMSFGVKVFSPFHDLGVSNDPKIAEKDFEGINNSDIIFCMLDNLDPGTLIEAGFSLGCEKPIIVYCRTCEEKDLFMLSSGRTKIYNHLTTAIYQTLWKL